MSKESIVQKVQAIGLAGALMFSLTGIGDASLSRKNLSNKLESVLAKKHSVTQGIVMLKEKEEDYALISRFDQIRVRRPLKYEKLRNVYINAINFYEEHLSVSTDGLKEKGAYELNKILGKRELEYDKNFYQDFINILDEYSTLLKKFSGGIK